MEPTPYLILICWWVADGCRFVLQRLQRAWAQVLFDVWAAKRLLRLRHLMYVGVALVVIGVATMVPPAYYHITGHGSVAAQAVLVSQPVPKAVKKPIVGQPLSISVPSVQINDVPVIPGYYDKTTNEWTLTWDKAQFATMTVPPNDHNGDTFIYGHYRPEVFAYLHHIEEGAQATIKTDNGYVFTYTYESSVAVSPDDTSIFSYTGPPVLTIQTCSGSYFQNRQLYRFKFTSVEKA